MGLNNKLNRVNSAIDSMRSNFSLMEDASIEKIADLAQYGSQLNIYCQEDEPSGKDGLWLKTNKTYNAIAREDYYSTTDWVIDTESYPAMDSKFVGGAAVQINDYVFFFSGWAYSTDRCLSFKYHIPTKTTTRIKNCPIVLDWGIAVVIGNEIYFGGEYGKTNFYKYNIETDTYTKLANVGYLYGATMAVSPDKDYIYAFGGIYNLTSTPLWIGKYSIENNKWTILSIKNPDRFGGGTAFVYGNEIYFPCMRCFPDWNVVRPATNTYKFNMITESWTKLGACPQDIIAWGGNIIDDNIYFTCNRCQPDGSTDVDFYTYKYNITTDTYTQMGNLPRTSQSSARLLALYDNKFFMFGGSGFSDEILSLAFPDIATDKEYSEDTLIVWENPMPIENSLSCQLIPFGLKVFNFEKLGKFYFKTISYYSKDEGLDLSLPAYYGNGTEWIQI